MKSLTVSVALLLALSACGDDSTDQSSLDASTSTDASGDMQISGDMTSDAGQPPDAGQPEIIEFPDPFLRIEPNRPQIWADMQVQMRLFFVDGPMSEEVEDVDWSVDDESVATITEKGLLEPQTVGSVVVAAVARNLETSTRVSVVPRMAGVATGRAHTCALGLDGRAFCFGANESGQAGQADVARVERPTLVDPSGTSFVRLWAGGDMTCARASNDELYCWGDNEFGQLGDGTTEDRSTPGPVDTTAIPDEVAIGRDFVCMLTYADPFETDLGGEIRCWGDNRRLQTASSDAGPITGPALVSNDDFFLDFGAGDSHACATRADTLELECWGDNSQSQLGAMISDDPSARALAASESFAVAAGGARTCNESTMGIRCWGSAPGGLGDEGMTEASRMPVSVDIAGPAFSTMSLSSSHACVRGNPALSCWGENDAGQLGTGDTQPQSTPTSIQSMGAVTSFDTGARHTCALASSAIFCWGDNAENQLGLPGATTSDFPQRVIPSTGP